MAAAAYNVAPASVAVEAVDVNKVKVTFQTAVDTTKVTVALKQGAATQYTTCTFADDKKSATLTAPVAITAGDYTVVVKGLVSADVTAPITIAAETAKSIEMTSASLTIGATSKATFIVKNQYGTDMKVLGSAIAVSAYDVTAVADVTVAGQSGTESSFTLNLTASTTLKVGNDVRVIVSYKGLTASKTVKIIAAASSADVTLGAVAPLTGKTRITASETGFTLPYTLKDQYGADATLPTTVAGAINTNGSGVTFLSSNTGIVDPATFAVDAKGVLTFNAGATAGTATITAIINATGKVATTTVTVNAVGAIKTIAISSPTALLAGTEVATLALTAVDQYGAAVTSITGVTVTSGTTAVATAAIVNNKLVVTGAGTAGTTTITLTKTGDATTVYGTITVRYEVAAVPTAITGYTGPTVFEKTAASDIAFSKFTTVDQYGRAYTLTGTQVTAAPVVVGDTTFTIASPGGKFTLTAGSTVATEAVKFSLANGAAYTVTYAVVAASSIASYAVTNAPALVYSKVAPPAGSGSYDVALTLGGKLADGTSVVLVTNKVVTATSTNTAAATVAVASNVATVSGVAAGTSTIALWSVTGAKLAEVTVTVSAALPVATTVAIDDSTPFVAAVAATADIAAKLTVKDQYGVTLAKDGFWASSDATIATVSAAGVVTGVAAGTATITYVTTNGLVVTTTVTVQ